jgi:hypothetical protein
VTSGCVVPVHDPPAIVVSCDGSSVISKIHWQRWDSPLASGTGTQSLDTCIPDCATGAHRLIDVRLQASDPKRCPSGLLQYRRVVVYPSGSAVGESLGGVAECPPQ